MTFVATTLAYVRTPEGVVALEPGEAVPDNAASEHVDVLVGRGVLTDQTETPRTSGKGRRGANAVSGEPSA